MIVKVTKLIISVDLNKNPAGYTSHSSDGSALKKYSGPYFFIYATWLK